MKQKINHLFQRLCNYTPFPPPKEKKSFLSTPIGTKTTMPSNAKDMTKEQWENGEWIKIINSFEIK